MSLDTDSDQDDARPTLDRGGADADAAEEAIGALVAELQAGWDGNDADIADRRLAADVLWGSPFGANVHGYPDLHAIHVRLKEQGMGGPSSRFEVVKVLAPAADVVVAQLRRVALDADGEPVEPSAELGKSFSESALYVLVRRGRDWWVAAGQFTPIRDKP